MGGCRSPLVAMQGGAGCVAAALRLSYLVACQQAAAPPLPPCHPPASAAQIYTLLDDYPAAINVYMDALQHSPENTEVLTTLGLLFLRWGGSACGRILQPCRQANTTLGLLRLEARRQGVRQEFGPRMEGCVPPGPQPVVACSMLWWRAAPFHPYAGPTVQQPLTQVLSCSPPVPHVQPPLPPLSRRSNDNAKAFEYLGNSLAHDPRNPRTILAAGSIIQVGYPHL